MVFVISTRIKGFKLYQSFLDDRVHDVKGYDRALFYFCDSSNDGTFKMKKTPVIFIDITKSEDELYNDFKDNTKRAIKDSAKMDIKVTFNDGISGYDEFISMFNNFIKTKGLKLPVMTADILDQNRHMLAEVRHNGKLLVAHYYLLKKDFALFIFACSERSRENNKVVGAASRAIHWETMKYLKRSGFKTLSLASVEAFDERTQGITDYKMSFGGYVKEIEYYQKDYSPMLKLLEYWKSPK